MCLPTPSQEDRKFPRDPILYQLKPSEYILNKRYNLFLFVADLFHNDTLMVEKYSAKQYL